MSNYDFLTIEEKRVLKAFNKFVVEVPLKQDELLKEITVYGGNRYFISNYGKVYSLCNGKWKERQQTIGIDGYYYVDLYEDCEKIRFRTHRLVAMYFLDNPEGKAIVHHKDFNRRNNYYKNLIYVSAEEHRKIHNGKQ